MSYLLLLIPLAIWLAAFIDIIRNEFVVPNDKLIWALIVIFSPVVGAFFYFLIFRRHKIKVSN